MSTEVIIAFLAGIAAIGLGVYFFLEARKLSSTEIVPAADAKPGKRRVVVHGRAEPIDGKTVTAPVSGEPVFYAKAVRNLRESGSGSGPSIPGLKNRNRHTHGGTTTSSREVGTVVTPFQIDDLDHDGAGVRVDTRRLDLGSLESEEVQPHPEYTDGKSKIGKAADALNDVSQAFDHRAGRWYTETRLLPGQEVWVAGIVRKTKHGLEVHDNPKLYLKPMDNAVRNQLGMAGVITACGVAGIVFAVVSLF